MPPPVLVAAAVNSTVLPTQIAPAGFAVNVTVGVTIGFTTIVIIFDVAKVAVIQVPPVVNISTATVAPLVSVVVVNVLEAPV